MDEGWRMVTIGFEGGPAVVDGVDVWKHKWRSQRAQVQLPHPAYPDEMHSYSIWEVRAPFHRPVRFAACELSGGVYGFYEPA